MSLDHAQPTGEGIADDAPLRLVVEAEALAEIVDEAGEDHPAGMAVAADGFGGLEEVFNLGEVGCRGHCRRLAC